LGQPNILWICTDSQRWDTLGCYGNPWVRSPNVDRLAREGVLCTNTFVQNPLCTPSRGSFLTGRYPVTNRLRQNGQIVPTDLKLITKILADREYVCGLSGKLHLSHCDRRLTFGPEWWRRPDKDWIVPMERRIDDGYAVFHWSHCSDDNPYSAYTQWLRQQGAELGEKPIRPKEIGWQTGYGRPGHLTHTAFCVDKAVEFIELHALKNLPNPWLFSINMIEPHPNFHPPEEYLKPYLDRLDEIPLPSFVDGELDNKPAHQRDTYMEGKGNSTRPHSERDLRLVKAAYWAMCDMIDAHVGRLLDTLERTGQRQNTLVIFTSDHGELLGDHGRTWKGPYLYDGSVHVPLIFSMPGTVKAGERLTGLVELTDLAPTLLDLTGLPREPGMQGRSLWPLLAGSAPLDRFRDDVYCEYYNSNKDQPSQWLTMVRTDKYKLIALHGTREGELYDLVADPGENRNLWNDPASKDLKIEMLLRLNTRMAHTADPLPVRVGVF
jgi:arylsulfatase